MRARSIYILALFLMMAGLSSIANGQLVGSDDKVINAFQVEEPPVLDGVLDDDAWAFATIIDDLHEVRPDEFTEPSERSLIYVVYTREALYVAARFFDSEPDKISAQVLRQGDFSFGEDSFDVMLDPFNNGRSGYIFDLTANAVRNQALYENVTKENWSWDGIWHGATSIDEEGWIAEIEIPFKTLSFDPANDTWGINFARYIGRKSEQIGWLSTNRKQDPSLFGEVAGMRGMDQGIGLDVVPSVRVGQSKNFESGATSDSTEPAVDIFYKLTPALTAALTFNTDFSGTGVDARQINLTRFGLFFRERRSFFLQDTDIFEFGGLGSGGFQDNSTISRVERESGRPFFSRRIGLASTGETIDILGGGKLTGRLGEWDIGILGIRQDEYQTLGASDLFVARLSRNVLEESSIGVILTDGDPESDFDSTLAGIDFRYLNTRLASGGTLEGSLWYQQSDTEGVSDDNAAFGASLRMPNAEGLRASISYKELQRNYYPALGFVNRANVRDLAAGLGYTWFPQNGMFREVFSGVDYQRIETIEGELQSQVVTLRPLELNNHYGDSIRIHYQLLDEFLDAPFTISEGVTIPVGDYSWNQYCVSLSTGEYRKVTAHASYCGGEFYDGTLSTPGLSLVWRPNAHFKISAGYELSDIDLPYGDFMTRLASLRADIAFNTTWYWENFVQYDNVTYGMGLNSILRWIPRAGREMVLVVNREFIDYTRDHTFTSVTGDITFKFSYTFRF